MIIQRVPSSVVSDFVKSHHYSKGHHNRPISFAVYDEQGLAAAVMFCTPVSENVRRSVFGPDYVNSVIELHRLVVRVLISMVTEKLLHGPFLTQ